MGNRNLAFGESESGPTNLLELGVLKDTRRKLDILKRTSNKNGMPQIGGLPAYLMKRTLNKQGVLTSPFVKITGFKCRTKKHLLFECAAHKMTGFKVGCANTWFMNSAAAVKSHLIPGLATQLTRVVLLYGAGLQGRRGHSGLQQTQNN